MIECQEGKKTGDKCPFSSARLDELLVHVGREHGRSFIIEGTIASGEAIDRDPSCRWMMVVCRNPEGSGGCGEMRWTRYYGQVRNPSANRMCLSCNKNYGARFVIGKGVTDG